MSVITVVYSTDSSNRVVPSVSLEWARKQTFVITDHPFLQRSVFSKNEINVCKKNQIGEKFAGPKPILSRIVYEENVPSSSSLTIDLSHPAAGK